MKVIAAKDSEFAFECEGVEDEELIQNRMKIGNKSWYVIDFLNNLFLDKQQSQ